MAEIPSCCDTEWDLLRKTLLQLISQTGSSDPSLLPIPSDSSYNLYRKILLALASF